jgi:N-acetylmuramoyl-L-alanine amidase
MRWPAPFLFGCGTALLAALMGCNASAAPTAPTRPGKQPVASAAPRVPLMKDVSIVEIAAQLGLKAHWKEGQKSVTLSDGRRRLEMEADSRDTQINGVRVFLGNPVRVRNGRLSVSRIDYDTCLVPLLRPGAGVPAAPVLKVIALDAGHGGIDQGAQNAALKLQEKAVSLDVVLRLKKLLETRGYKVVLTRRDDRELSTDKKKDLAMRSEAANRAGADLFISIHFNSNPDSKISGIEMYTFTPRYQRSSNSWSTNEEDVETEAAPVNRFDHWNAVIAHALHRNVVESLKTADRGKKLYRLGVLRRLNCPGVLVESAFLSNEAEAKRIARPEYRQQIAAALAAGVDDYAAIVETTRKR